MLASFGVVFAAMSLTSVWSVWPLVWKSGGWQVLMLRFGCDAVEKVFYAVWKVVWDVGVAGVGVGFGR